MVDANMETGGRLVGIWVRRIVARIGLLWLGFVLGLLLLEVRVRVLYPQ